VQISETFIWAPRGQTQFKRIGRRQAIYFAVLEEGLIQPGNRIELIRTDGRRVAISDMFTLILATNVRNCFGAALEHNNDECVGPRELLSELVADNQQLTRYLPAEHTASNERSKIATVSHWLTSHRLAA
jgi:hypothetical protein